MKKFKDIMTIIIGFSILLAITYGFIFFFGGAIFFVLGLKYKSIWSLAKFIAIYMIIALPIDFIIYTFFKIVRQVKNISTIEYNAVYFFADVPTNMIIIGITEFFMKDISCSMLTAFLFSSICYLINIYFDLILQNKENKKETV